MKKIENRKVLLINPGFQLRIIGTMLLAGTVTTTLLGLAFMAFIKMMINEGIRAGFPEDHFYFTLITQFKANLLWIFICVVALSVFFLAGVGLILSHRIAGPLYQLGKYLESYDKNNAIQLNFRKGDFFPELPEKVNKFINLHVKTDKNGHT